MVNALIDCKSSKRYKIKRKFTFFSVIAKFIINKVMKYRKILIKYNAYLKKAVFHNRENIKSCIFTAVKI